MYKPSWEDIETFAFPCFLILCIICLAIIYLNVTRSCDTIFLTGGDCGVGIGWFGLAAVFFVIGVSSHVPGLAGRS